MGSSDRRRRIDAGDLVDGTVRAAAVRAIASRRDRETLDWILSRTLVIGGLLRRTRLAPIGRIARQIQAR